MYKLYIAFGIVTFNTNGVQFLWGKKNNCLQTMVYNCIGSASVTESDKLYDSNELGIFL